MIKRKSTIRQRMFDKTLHRERMTNSVKGLGLASYFLHRTKQQNHFIVPYQNVSITKSVNFSTSLLYLLLSGGDELFVLFALQSVRPNDRLMDEPDKTQFIFPSIPVTFKISIPKSNFICRFFDIPVYGCNFLNSFCQSDDFSTHK